MKRLLLLLSVLFVALALSACTIESVEEYEKSSNERIAKQEAQQEEDAIEEEIEQTTRDTTIEDTTTASKEPETSTTTKKEETKSPAKPKEEPVQTPTKPQTTQPAPQTTSPSKVTISIDAKVLVNHMDKLKPALQNEKYVPKDGVILKETSYEITDKDTVWDIFLKATKEYKIPIEYQGATANAYGSVYIEGINHLYEKDAGELSGWMYSVNGEFPGHGISEHTLKDGDKIEFKYTTDLGRDLGQKVPS